MVALKVSETSLFQAFPNVGVGNLAAKYLLALIPEPRIIRTAGRFAKPLPNECGYILIVDELGWSALKFEHRGNGIVPTLALNEGNVAVLVVELLAHAKEVGEVHGEEGNGRRCGLDLLQ